MGEIQIPFATIPSAGADLVDPENDLVAYFLSIDTQPIASVIARAFSSHGPKGYGVSLLLSRILKIKQVFISDRILGMTSQRGGYLPKTLWFFRWQPANA